MSRPGGCQCGAVRYEVTGEPGRLFACHCTECRKQSASAFGMSLEVRTSDLRLTKGTPRFWSRPTASGRTLRCAFCQECGSRLWHEAEPALAWLSVKNGSLDEPIAYDQAIHIWTRSRLAGFPLPDDRPSYPEEPD